MAIEISVINVAALWRKHPAVNRSVLARAYTTSTKDNSLIVTGQLWRHEAGLVVVMRRARLPARGGVIVT